MIKILGQHKSGLKDQITGLVAKASAQLAGLNLKFGNSKSKLTEFQNNESELKPYEHFLAVLRLRRTVLSARRSHISRCEFHFGSSEKCLEFWILRFEISICEKFGWSNGTAFMGCIQLCFNQQTK